MKVLLLAPGSWIHSQRCLKLLLRSGCEVTFVDYVDPKPDAAGYQFLSYPSARGERLRGLVGSRVTDALGLFTVMVSLKRLWRRSLPDVVHVLWADERAYHCARAGLRPLVLSLLGSDINRLLQTDADNDRRRQVGEALRRADLVIADAPDMVEKCGLVAGRPVPVELLTLGVDTKTFRPGYGQAALQWRASLGVPGGAKLLFSVRALEKKYGHHLILEAFAQALPRFDKPAFLVFKVYNPSKWESYEPELVRQAERLSVSPFVRWVRDVPFRQLPELYAASDAVVNYPVMDAFPVSFLEAAACERPVISVRLPSYAGTFVEKHFRLVERGDIPGLTDAMVDVLNEDGRQGADRLTELRREVEQGYDEAVIAARLIGFYEKVVRAGVPQARGSGKRTHRADLG